MRVMTVVLAACAASALTTGGPAWAARGGDGELKILFWQAVSTLNPYLSGGIKEGFASSIVLEPLASFNEKGELTSRLAESLPTLENLHFPRFHLSDLEAQAGRQMVGRLAIHRR